MESRKAKKPIRYMDFIGRKPGAASDPLASRPVSRPVAKPKPVAKVHSVADQIPPKGARPVPKPSPAVAVKKDDSKPYISRKPATSRDLYPEPKTPAEKKPAFEKPLAKPEDNLAIKASAALTGSAKPAERKAPDNNAYSLGGKSPFLKNYNVDKRPLSNSIPDKKKSPSFEKLSYLGVTDEKGHKNIYEKPEKSEEKSAKKSDKPVKIIDDTKKKHGVPVWLVIILTILLGAGVGAGVYFLLPK